MTERAQDVDGDCLLLSLCPNTRWGLKRLLVSRISLFIRFSMSAVIVTDVFPLQYLGGCFFFLFVFCFLCFFVFAF